MRSLLLLLIVFVLHSSSGESPRLAYVLPVHQAVLYLYEAQPGARR